MASFDPSSTSTAIQVSMQDLYDKIILYVPNVVVAAIVLIVGWLLGKFLGDVFRRIVVAIKLDEAGDKLGLSILSQRTGRNFKISAFVKWVIKWFFFLIAFITAADILGLDQVTSFFYQDVLFYVGHVIVAIAILVLGILAANFFSGLVEGALKAGEMKSSQALASVTRWAILVFAIIAALSELQIASDFLHDLFRAIVAMLAIAGGIAFGLGGKGHAERILSKVEGDLGRKF